MECPSVGVRTMSTAVDRDGGLQGVEWSISILGELREGKEIGDDRDDGEFREGRM